MDCSLNTQLKHCYRWKKELRRLAEKHDETIGQHFSSTITLESFVSYHSQELVDFALNLDWAQLRREYEQEQTKSAACQEETLIRFPTSIVRIIGEYATPLWEGSWYTSGEVFLRFFTENQFVGIFGVLYVLIGEVSEGNSIQFHQYPIQQNEFTDMKVTLFGTLDESNRRIESKFAHGFVDDDSCVRGPTLVRDAGPRIILNCAAKNDLEGLRTCIKNGIDVNVSSEEVQSSTPLMMAAVSGHVEAVKFLLENRANPLMERPNGITALTYARQRHYTEIIQLLKDEIEHLGVDVLSTTSDSDEEFDDYAEHIV